MEGIKFVDNSSKVLKKFHTQKGVALNMTGTSATGHTKDNTPIRTGKLVNTADWETSKDEEFVEVGFKKDDDVKYAIPVELGTRKQRAQHMLKRGVMEHTDEYKQIAKRAFENG